MRGHVTCPEWRRLQDMLLAADPEPVLERAAREHLERCPACRGMWQGLFPLDLYREGCLLLDRTTQGFTARIMAEIGTRPSASPAANSPRRGWSRLPRSQALWHYASSALATAVLVLVNFFGIFDGFAAPAGRLTAGLNAACRTTQRLVETGTSPDALWRGIRAFGRGLVERKKNDQGGSRNEKK